MTVRALRRGSVAGRGAQAAQHLALVQFASGSTGAVVSPTSIMPAFTAASTANNTVILIVGSNAVVTTPGGWTLDRQQVNDAGHYVYSQTSSGQTTFPAVNVAGPTDWALLEISGLTTGLIDKAVSAGSSSYSVTPFSTGTTPTLASTTEICIATWVGSSSSGTVTWSGYTNSYVNPGINPGTSLATGTNLGMAVAFQTVSSTGAQQSTATPSLLSAPTAIMVTYAAGVITASVPDAPTGTAAAAGNGQATVNWTAPYNGGAVIDSYRVTSTPATTTQTTASTGIIFTGLANGTSYTFKVAAHNSVGWGSDSVASNAVVPATASLRQIDGGTSYYSSWGTVGGNPFSDSASFFPIGVWFESVTQQSDVDLDKACGLNMYVVLTGDSVLSLVQSNGMKFLAQTGDAWEAQIGSPGITGWTLSDEIDMIEGPGTGFTTMAGLVASHNEGRIRYNNYGKGVCFWESDVDAAQFVNTYQAILSADTYFFTDPNISSGTEGGTYYAGQTLTYDQTKFAHNYGLTIDRLRGLVAPSRSKPVWGFVEVGWPFTETAPQGGRAILPAECQAAVWQSIIHGARGIVYFNHSFGGPNISQHCLRDAAYATIRAAVTATNAQITALAPVLNAPFVDSYASTSDPVDFMVKFYNGRYYIFAGSRLNTTSQNATFTIPDSGTATVLDESRTIPIVGGHFTDTFADGNAYHKYQIN